MVIPANHLAFNKYHMSCGGPAGLKMPIHEQLFGWRFWPVQQVRPT